MFQKKRGKMPISTEERLREKGWTEKEISRAIGADSRIGSKFLNASIGFGGS